jgi:hypothetical protein
MRSSLRALLLGLTGLAVIVVELSGLTLDLTGRIAAARQRTEVQIQRLSAGVAPVLLNALVVGDLATAEQTLRTMNLDQSWREVRLYEADGQKVILDVSPAGLASARAPPCCGAPCPSISASHGRGSSRAAWSTGSSPSRHPR